MTTGATTNAAIYLASRTHHADRWRVLRDAGYPIVSSWIDEAAAGHTLDWRALWDRCVAEAAAATALIVYAEPGDGALRGALVEVGAALSHGVPVYLVSTGISREGVLGSASFHRLVTACGSLEEALQYSTRWRRVRVPVVGGGDGG